VPVLLVAGTADTTVPIDAIDRFAEQIRAPLVYRRLEGVEHVEAWNAAPAAYEATLRAFLTGVADGTRGTHGRRGADGARDGDGGGDGNAAEPSPRRARQGRGLSADRSA